MSNKLYAMLGLARRARKLVIGESAITTIQNQKARVVLVSDEASENTLKKVKDKCQFYNVTYGIVNDNFMNQAIGEFNTKIIAITDEGMAKKIREYMEEKYGDKEK